MVNIVFEYGIETIDLYIVDQGNFDNVIYVETKKDYVVHKLFNIFMEQKLKTGYTFPDLKVHMVR